MPSSDRPRWRIDELLFLYRLEPNIRDLFVEGASDVALLRWYLGDRGVRGVTVVGVECVDVPTDLVKKHGLEDNNRDRLVALAYRLGEGLSAASRSVTLVADADRAFVFGVPAATPFLLWTDYSSMEMYACNEKAVAKFLAVVCKATSHVSAEEALTQCHAILRQLFGIRAANKVLGLGLKAVDFLTDCAFADGRLTFDGTRYIRRYLDKNAARDLEAAVLQEVERVDDRMEGDARRFAHGKDFVRVLSFWCGKRCSQRKLVEEANQPQGYLLACVESASLSEEPLFRSLEGRLSA